VRGIETSWTAGRVLRLNLLYPVNKGYADSVGVERTPTFILYGPDGRERKRWVDTAPEVAELSLPPEG
jgi:hypothetical protein